MDRNSTGYKVLSAVCNTLLIGGFIVLFVVLVVRCEWLTPENPREVAAEQALAAIRGNVERVGEDANSVSFVDEYGVGFTVQRLGSSNWVCDYAPRFVEAELSRLGVATSGGGPFDVEAEDYAALGDAVAFVRGVISDARPIPISRATAEGNSGIAWFTGIGTKGEYKNDQTSTVSLRIVHRGNALVSIQLPTWDDAAPDFAAAAGEATLRYLNLVADGKAAEGFDDLPQDAAAKARRSSLKSNVLVGGKEIGTAFTIKLGDPGIEDSTYNISSKDFMSGVAIIADALGGWFSSDAATGSGGLRTWSWGIGDDVWELSLRESSGNTVFRKNGTVLEVSFHLIRTSEKKEYLVKDEEGDYVWEIEYIDHYVGVDGADLRPFSLMFPEGLVSVDQRSGYIVFDTGG
jgi:hypothetical protein